MKAKYIMNAIEAMRVAEGLSATMPPSEFGVILARLAVARIELTVYSGLRDVDLPVETNEKEAA